MQNNRPLTPEEFKLKPDWATHYVICEEDNDVIYESENKAWWSDLSEPIHIDSVNIRRSPIPAEPFNLESVEWSEDSGINKITKEDGTLVIEYMDWTESVETKQDIINKAKALSITAEDLK